MTTIAKTAQIVIYTQFHLSFHFLVGRGKEKTWYFCAT